MALSAEPQVIVYKATNLVNGHFYIGYTGRGLCKREKQHRYEAGRKQGRYLHRAIRKYGQENFAFEVLADFEGDEDLAKLYEREAIAKYRPRYNLSFGGEGGTIAEESRLRMSAAQKRRIFPPTGPMSAEQKAKISAAKKGKPTGWLGRKHTEEARQKMAARTYEKAAPETRAKMSASHTKRWADPTLAARAQQITAAGVRAAGDANKQAVMCVTDGRVFGSQREAEHFYGMSAGYLNLILRRNTPYRKLGLVFARCEPRE